MHDFRAKLSDPRAAAALEDYLDRARRRRAEPASPAGAPHLHGPVSINLDLTLACDYRCGHCIDAELLNGGHHLDPADVLATLELLTERGLRSVILIGGGEPTLYPFFEEVVAAIKKLGLECAISSNGAHNGRIAAVASRLGAKDWIRLSLDAGTDPTFQALHRPRKPIRLEQICAAAAALKQQAPHVQLGFSFVVMWTSPDNVDEMPAAAALAREHGFDYISFKPMLVRDDRRAEVIHPRQPETIERIRRRLQEAGSAADERFRVVPSRNLLALVDGTARQRSTLQPRECHMQQFRHVLSPAGIFACPAHRGNRSSLLAGPAGYSSPGAFQETARAAELQIQRFDAAVECSAVTCIYNETNWWLESLVSSREPVHPSVAGDFFL